MKKIRRQYDFILTFVGSKDIGNLYFNLRVGAGVVGSWDEGGRRTLPLYSKSAYTLGSFHAK